ncbi:MAG: efflux RND transporter periplasmic adaptor subunit [Salinivenus sp.]
MFLLCAVGAYMTGIFGASPTYVRTTVAERRSLTRTVEAFGRVHPRRWVAVRPQVSGQVAALAVEEGARVRKGALLARLRADRYESRVAKARARVRQRKALVAQRRADSVQARRRLERQTTLFEAGVSFEARRQNARHAMTTATARLAAARARVDEARAQLARIRQQGEHLEIRAPASGVVSHLRVDAGEHVVGTGLVPGTPMMRIDQVDRMAFRIRVDESNVPVVSIGDSATVQIEAHPDAVSPSRVAAVARSRQSRASSRRTGLPAITGSSSLFPLGTGYPVRLRLRCPTRDEDQPPAARGTTRSHCPALRTGMSGTARIRAATLDSAVTVPRSAVTFRRGPEATTPDKGGDNDVRSSRPVVFTVHNGVARRQIVDPGLRTDALVAIRSGLRPGDEVVAGPADVVHRRLSDGDAVAVHDALPVGSPKE